jgi:hydroxymethylbilane synthase
VTRLIIGTRGSALALAQVDLTEAALAKACPGVTAERRIFVTRGDQKLDLNLLRAGEAGGKGLFTRELEDALLAGTIDVAVHSLKDLPGNNPPGLEIAAVLERAPVADVLVGKSPGGLDALPQGARIGTSSVRRARQIEWRRPDIVIEEWRGNVPTRLRKLGERAEIAAIVLAEAGLRRLGYEMDLIRGRLVCESGEFHAASLADVLLPAIGQGAVALQIRADRREVSEVLGRINHEPTMLAIRAEREVQRLLAGNCSVPVGVRTELRGPLLIMSGILFGNPGEAPAEARAEGDAAAPETVAKELFRQLQRGAP